MFSLNKSWRGFLQVVPIAIVVAASTSMQHGCAIHLPAVEDNHFRSLFDGKTLKEWRGNPEVWSVEEGAITGRTDTGIDHNTYLIYSETFRNFELTFKYRFLSEYGNSGLQYRSKVIDEEKYVVSGYQANIVSPEAGKRFGFLWDEEARGLLAYLGEQVRIEDGEEGLLRQVIRSVNDPMRVLQAVKPYPEWNDYVVIAFDNHLIHAVNNYITVDVIDNQVNERSLEGLIALQLHGGFPMGFQVKDIVIRKLRVHPDLSERFIADYK